jgi:hypothetical protein
MPLGPQKLILINAGRYDYAEVDLRGSLQIVGPNNTGKTTLINTLQFLYIDNQRQMDFGNYSPEQTRDYYFPNQYSYILFECQGVRGRCVLGWRGTSKASGGEPERFTYEGPYESEDFHDEQRKVRDPKALSARLSRRQYTVLKDGQAHRDTLLQATKREGNGLGLVALRSEDKYPQFRETLKNLLSLNTITQDQMRERLLMLAGLSGERYALDVRAIFGEGYDRLIERKQKLELFKQHRSDVESLLGQWGQRAQVRGEMLFRWDDLRGKRIHFGREYEKAIQQRITEAETAARQIGELTTEISALRKRESELTEEKGGLKRQLDEIAKQAKEFEGFVEELAQAAVKNVGDEVSRLKHRLEDSEKRTRDEADKKLALYRDVVAQKRQVIAKFGDAFVSLLRKDLTDAELEPLARLFNFDLLLQPVGKAGIQLLNRAEFTRLLRGMSQRIAKDTYRDDNVVLPLPVPRHTMSELKDPEAVRDLLAEDEKTLKRWEDILDAIKRRETLQKELTTQQTELAGLQAKLFGWAQLQGRQQEVPQLTDDLKTTEEAIAAALDSIKRLDGRMETARKAKTNAENGKRHEEDLFNAVVGEFESDCLFPDFPGKPATPAEAIPDDFSAAISLFVRQQKQLVQLDQEIQNGLRKVEQALGSDYSGADETDTIRLLREELEALPDRETVLRQDWELAFHQMRATFDQVLRSLGDIRSEADRLNRAFAAVRVSNLKSVGMAVVEQAEYVEPLRRMVNLQQPEFGDDTAKFDAMVDGFRQKFQTNPLLRYSDLFTLRFTVTGDDGKPHHYHDFHQVESHGTTITIKVLFNLLVLRSLLREDASKQLLSEVPFFLDEIHSLDPVNRHAILSTARKLGFIAITAAPASVSEVDALYFLQPKQGRIVLRKRHQVGVKVKRPAA